MDILDRMRWYAIRQPQIRSIALHLYIDTQDSGPMVAEAMFKRVDPDDPRIRPPMIELTDDGAQRLMDELWSCGIRPTEGTGSAGALAATQAHLHSMQELNGRLLTIVERTALLTLED